MDWFALTALFLALPGTILGVLDLLDRLKTSHSRNWHPHALHTDSAPAPQAQSLEVRSSSPGDTAAAHLPTNLFLPFASESGPHPRPTLRSPSDQV